MYEQLIQEAVNVKAIIKQCIFQLIAHSLVIKAKAIHHRIFKLYINVAAAQHWDKVMRRQANNKTITFFLSLKFTDFIESISSRIFINKQNLPENQD